MDPILLYDGHCPFCRAQAQRLEQWAAGRVRLESFHDPGVLDRYPGLTHAECMKEIKLVEPGGHIWGGMEAVARTACYNPFIRVVAWIYFVPGIRQLCNMAYKWVAQNRYLFAGKDNCPEGACTHHKP